MKYWQRMILSIIILVIVSLIMGRLLYLYPVNETLGTIIGLVIGVGTMQVLLIKFRLI
jgi:uncharacterized membrane protein